MNKTGEQFCNEPKCDGIRLKDYGIENEEDIWELVYENDDVVLESRENGFSNPDEARYNSEPEHVFLCCHKDIYFVYGLPEMIDGYGLDELSFSLYFTKDKEAARAYYENVPYQEKPIIEQIKELRAATDDDRIWYDRKSIAGHGYWNVKVDYDLVIEKAAVISAEEAIAARNRYDDLKKKCDDAGFCLQNIYKHHEWNNNQRYYYFEFFCAGEEHVYKAHIPSKMQHKRREVLDFFDSNWLAEMAMRQKEFDKQMHKLTEKE